LKIITVNISPLALNNLVSLVSKNDLKLTIFNRSLS
jgi:hypothetical protein